ncbi:immunity protein Imm33 domain-containing protein [Massilia antarctica]
MASVVPYLSLPPGYRFQIADGYEDVWFDPALLVEK